MIHSLASHARLVRYAVLACALPLAACDSATEESSSAVPPSIESVNTSTAASSASLSGVYCPNPSDVEIQQYDSRVKLVEIVITQNGSDDGPFPFPFPDPVAEEPADGRDRLDDSGETPSVLSRSSYSDEYTINRRAKTYNGSFGPWSTIGKAYGNGGSASFIDFSWFAEYNSNPFARYVAEYKVTRVCSKNPYNGSTGAVESTYVRAPYNSY